MLGIVNPSSLVNVKAFKKNFIRLITNIAIIVDGATSGGKRIVQHMGKYAINVVRRTTSKWFANPQRDHCTIEIQDVKGLIRPMEIEENVHIDAVYMKFAGMFVMMTML